jgi:FtsP/CotA-like multicopper oxidase with cupredoxin domain
MATRDRNAGLTFAVLASLFAVLIAGIAVAVANGGDGGGGSGGDAAAAPVAVNLSEFAIDPGAVMVEAGPVTFDVTNAGTATHNLTIEESGATTGDIDGGGTATLDAGNLAAGDYTLLCTIPGHADSGMTGTLTVMDAADMAGMEASGGGTTDTTMDYEAMSEAMNASILEFPAETEGLGAQELAPTVAADGTKEFELTAEIAPWEVSPGEVVDAWTYNGAVPAPTMHVDQGDHVRVTVHNELPAATDVHFHGVRLPNEMDGVSPITQDLIEPGEDFVYEFDADEVAVAMYHPHHMGQLSVPNGMFGAFYIGEVPLPSGTIGGREVPADLDPAVDMPMVLNDSGVIGLSLNGKSFPATAPVVVDDGDWVKIDYFNEGELFHPMHLHQFPQLVYAEDGIPLDQPYWVDTLTVGPGERFSVLAHMDNPGTWVWHCHILSHVERESGHFGMLTAVVVQERVAQERVVP